MSIRPIGLIDRPSEFSTNPKKYDDKILDGVIGSEIKIASQDLRYMRLRLCSTLLERPSHGKRRA